LFQYNPKDKIALFEFNACSGDYGAYSESVINAIDSLHKYDIQHLFIDITQNLGGASKYVSLLLNYLNFPAWDKSSGQQYTYNNKVYLIQSNYTSSAAVTLSCHFKYYRLGTIIGEETGGLTASYSSAQMLTLPNSQLTMYCATTRTVDKGGQWDGHGVLPDVAYSMKESHRFESFTWGELKEMLRLMENKKVQT
jgi:C-terminal processing protease CtpA/Prc